MGVLAECSHPICTGCIVVLRGFGEGGGRGDLVASALLLQRHGGGGGFEL